MTMPAQTQTARTVTAFFDKREAVSEAVEELVKAGFPRTSVRLVPGMNQPGSSITSATHTEGGFWEALKDFFFPAEDRYTYAEGLRRGGYLVIVSSNEANYQRALDIMDREGAIDINQRVLAWRKEGWKDWSAHSSGRTAAASTQRSTSASEREQVLPVVEEELLVGKRETAHGKVRIRSYVIEQPISQQVRLKDEHVHVERHAVDRPVRPGEGTFQERTIVAEETREEPVVTKQARVKEEVVVKKDAEQRTQTISDKVRRTEVKVEDARGNPVQRGKRQAG